MVTVPGEQAPANSVPAAAVRRRVLALFGITGRKGRAGGLVSRARKPGAQPRNGARDGGAGGRGGGGGHPGAGGSSSMLGGAAGGSGGGRGGGGGVPSVEVKFVDMGWNTGGEGGRLARS